MRRREAIALVAAAVASIGAGVTWLFGAYGLVAAGAVVLVATLFVDVDEEA